MPGRTNGLIRNAGTRRPVAAPSRTGGGTWSYQPPELSYCTSRAELGQAELASRLFSTARISWWPFTGWRGACSVADVDTM